MSDKLDLKTPDMVNINIERIAALFPHCVTETMDGKQIDFDLLRQELSADIVEGPKERYRLEWPGKREAIVTANMPTTNTLRPVREDSVNFYTTENLYIEGDNLEVLKLLQESYLGKIKMIYIDPPYNTGNDFVYRDNFAQDSDEYKADSGMTDELGNRLVANPETSGRYHSDWLTMMYPRLKLARNLLTDDGVIFISIDDNEVHNLRKMCDEVFGESNFEANIVWQKKYGPANDAKGISFTHEHILVFSKHKTLWMPGLLERNKDQLSAYKNPDNDKRGPWRASDLSARTYSASCDYVITGPTGVSFSPPASRAWIVNKDSYERLLKDNRITFGVDGNGRPMQKKFLSEVKAGITPETWLDRIKAGDNKVARYEMKEIFPENIFDTPKPTTLLNHLIRLSDAKNNAIILDFFSGSATTAHAVMQLNAEDGGNRKFIMVQLPEKTDEKSEAYKAGYKNICEIGKERIRRAGAKIVPAPQPPKGTAPQPPKGGAESGSLSLFGADEANSELKTQNSKLDIGFRVYRLDTSNMQDVYYRPQDYKQDMMTELFANHIKPDRTADDLVAQVMLDWGLPLSLPIDQTTIARKTVYKVAGNALYCCFDEGIDEEFVKALVETGHAPSNDETPHATYLPLRIVFHDYAFADDTAKENVRQLLKQLSGETEMRVV
ncbi:MAG: site-specific DNA-methyltransferase [Paludibacteraceae bacterium]